MNEEQLNINAIQNAREIPQARGRTREREEHVQDRWRSASPRGDALTVIDEPPNLDEVDNTIIGGSIREWNAIIADHNDPEIELILRNIMRSFTTQFEITDDSDDDSTVEEVGDNTGYTEVIYARNTRTYHKVYTGPNGGKFFYTPNGQKKYIIDREAIVYRDEDETPIVDTNPALQNTIVATV